MRIASNSLHNSLPYFGLFHEALSASGISVLDEPVAATTDWIRRFEGVVDAAHFHWPEDHWTGPPAWALPISRMRLAWRIPKLFPRQGRDYMLTRFTLFLQELRRSGIRIVWTLHDIEPHDCASRVDQKGFEVMADAADLIICHSAHAVEDCRRRYNAQGRFVVMPHGNFDGVYPAPRRRDVVLREFGLRTDRPVVTFVGLIRNYKGVDVACEAVRRLNGKVQLLVGGRVSNYDARPLRKLISEIPGAVLVERGLMDQEFADLINAADAVLLPYRRITGSGVLLAALTLGRGVIASDLPYFREVLADHDMAGVLFPAGDVSGLATAIETYLEGDVSARNRAARVLADDFAWSKVIRPVVDVFEEWSEAPSASRNTPIMSDA